MARSRTTIPTGHGEVLAEPAYEQWAALIQDNVTRSRDWTFELCGEPVSAVRAQARAEALERAREFSARLGVPVRDASTQDLLVVTGHQPEIYHPGIWIKDFLLQRLSEDTGAAAIDVVVDSDSFDTVEVHSPCLRPDVRVCRAFLAVGTVDGCYACTPVPPPDAIRMFCAAAAEHLATLPAPAIGHHFARFCTDLEAAAADAHDLGELLTMARRRFEAPAGTDYLELPVTSMARSRAFATLVAHMALHADEFARVYNGALADYRDRTGVRTPAQPFPDLRCEEGLIELPLWHLRDGGRTTVWARTGAVPALVADGDVLCELGECGEAVETIMGSQLVPAPKALTLTMFTRLLVADFFIHGVGGGKYDQVTDDVFRRFFGIEPPAYAVASMTVYLPLGAHVVRDEEIEQAAMTLNRIKHNPDQMLDEVEFETAEEHSRAAALAQEKSDLVEEIRATDADRKTIGRKIREVNDELAAMLAPIERQLQDELAQLRQLREASEILTDRTYPYCFWSPQEIADKAR